MSKKQADRGVQEGKREERGVEPSASLLRWASGSVDERRKIQDCIELHECGKPE